MSDDDKFKFWDMFIELQHVSLDPQLHKAFKEKTDYTKVFCEVEDGLEEDYRGWPIKKERIVF